MPDFHDLAAAFGRPEDEPIECPECNGTGTLVASPDRFTRAYEPCPVCDGSGVIDPPDEDPDEKEAPAQ